MITMDADLQDSPDEIPELYRMVAEQGYDLVSGWKKKRYDPLGKTLPSKFFNATAPAGVGHPAARLQLPGLKAYRRKGRQKHRGIRRDATVSYRYWPSRPVSGGSARRSSVIGPCKYGVSKFGWSG